MKTENGFSIATKSGTEVEAKKIIFATGVKDIMPDINGFSECWGISVIHCPYCHGYEYKSQNTGIMANGEKAFHLASLVYNLTDSITILTLGKSDFTLEQADRLKKHHIEVVENEISSIQHDQGQIREVVFGNGDRMSFDAVYAAIPFEQHTEIPDALGCELTEQGYIKVDDFQRTTVGGIYACGDNSTKMRSVSNAIASGNFTGAMVNMELTQENF